MIITHEDYLQSEPDGSDFRYSIIDVMPGTSYTINRADAKAAASTRMLKFPANSSFNHVYTYWNVDEAVLEAGTTRNYFGTTAEILLPHNADATIYAVGTMSNIDDAYFRTLVPYDQVTEVISVPNLKVEFAPIDNNNYTTTVTGTADVLTDIWMLMDEASNVYFFQDHIRNPHSTIISKSLFPDTLANIYTLARNWPVTLSHVNVTNYKKIESYHDYQKILGNRRYPIDQLLDLTGGKSEYYTFIPTNGGIKEKFILENINSFRTGEGNQYQMLPHLLQEIEKTKTTR